MLESRRGECVNRGEIHVAFEFFVDLRELAVLPAIPKLRSLLESEAIGGDMIGREINGLPQVGLPLIERFAGHAKHQIERHPHSRSSA